MVIRKNSLKNRSVPECEREREQNRTEQYESNLQTSPASLTSLFSFCPTGNPSDV